jgi:hypothetical protein
VVKNPTLCGQLFTNFRRRLTQFGSSAEEIMLLVVPVIFWLTQLFLTNITIEGLGQVDEMQYMDWERTKRKIHAQLYPFATQVCIIYGGGLFVFAIFKDYFSGLRTFLNFAGMWPLSYSLGLFLAEYLLCLLMVGLYVLIGVALDKIMSTDNFTVYCWEFSRILTVFGFAFLAFTHAVSYPVAWLLESTPTNAAGYGFRFIILPNLALKVSGNLAFDAVKSWNLLDHTSADKVAYFNPFLALDRAFNKVITGEAASFDDIVLSETGVYLRAMAIQGSLLLLLALYLDMRRVTAYRGIEKAKDWDSNEYIIQARGLTKVFSAPQGDFAAVDKSSISVKQGEVLGLLGPNGAGKTTTFDMLTLALQRTSGDCKLVNERIDDVNTAAVTLGMCASHNTIVDSLTVE